MFCNRLLTNALLLPPLIRLCHLVQQLELRLLVLQHRLLGSHARLEIGDPLASPAVPIIVISCCSAENRWLVLR